MKGVSGGKVFSLVSKKHLEITEAEQLRGKCLIVSVTCSLSVPQEILHPLATSQLHIFSMLNRECNSLTVTANVIVKRAF